LELFVAPFTSMRRRQSDFEWTKIWATSFNENPHQNGQMDFQGFQNCPDFCNNMDKSLCTGTFLVPELDDGTYTFQWRWEFNAGTAPYVTCFEAQVSGDFDGTIPIPTRRPTDVNAPAPTSQPGANCGAEWSQCGGSAMSYDCCVAGLQCYKKDNWYSQCRASCPDDATWECQTAPAPTQPPSPVAAPTNPPVEAPTTPEPTNPPVEAPTPATEQCTSSRVQFATTPKKQNANDATHCWEKCQANKTKKNQECLGWEWVEGDAKPCRLYTDASTTVAGLRECHPTQGWTV